GRLDQRSDIDAPGDERGKALRAAADLRNGDVRTGEAELFEQDADGNIGLGAEGADAEGLAFEIAHADPRLGEHGDGDGVAGRGHPPQVRSLLVGENGWRQPHMHALDFAREQNLQAARAPSILMTSTLSPSFS